ncbi:HNH endonuclease [Natronoarchaeum rubrum]|uniref:HNH endonuclease n=1 Tax=Natronoarchaeum rubrum TaxID=755311 RepID=UPI002112924A|nr:HNH endonuclease [Natronoarchaeum rubrum]
MSDECYFCGEQEALDQHHIVPKRHGGSDRDKNLVTVCPTCHRKLEMLYDDQFYADLGVEDDPETVYNRQEPTLDVVKEAEQRGGSDE